MLRLRGTLVWVCGTAAVLLSAAALQAGAAPLIETGAFAEASEGGEDPGFEADGDSTSTAGVGVDASAFRCPGLASCVFPPNAYEFSGAGAYASARTTFGANHARASASSSSGENSVSERAEATSLWADDWTFFAPAQGAGVPVALDIHLDGGWHNGDALYELDVFDTTLPVEPGPEDPEPFLPFELQAVALFFFDSTAEAAVAVGVGGFQIIPVADGGDASGNVDLDATIRFIPVIGRTYTVAARLLVSAEGEDAWVDFGSTGEVARVVLPEGVSFTSAAGAGWNTEVPEPALASLLGAGVLVLVAARRRR